MDYKGFEYAFYVLSPTFLTSLGIIGTMLGLALISILIDNITYSRLAVAHMMIFIISTWFFYRIPTSIATDIIVASFSLLCTMKAIGSIFAGVGRTRYIFERSLFGCLVMNCVSILLDTILFEGKRGQTSVVVQSLRKGLGGVRD
jgi:hypothetical protein